MEAVLDGGWAPEAGRRRIVAKTMQSLPSSEKVMKHLKMEVSGKSWDAVHGQPPPDEFPRESRNFLLNLWARRIGHPTLVDEARTGRP